MTVMCQWELFAEEEAGGLSVVCPPLPLWDVPALIVHLRQNFLLPLWRDV